MPENNKQPQTRQQKIEQFLLDPEKTIFESLEEFQAAAEQLLSIFDGVDISSLEQLVGEDGKTPVRGEDYFTEEDLQEIENFIISKIPVVGQDLPSVQQVTSFIAREVAKIPRVKGDKGEPGQPGKPGKDGSPDTGPEIIKKIREARNTNQALKITDIRGLKKVLTSYKEALEELPELRDAIENIRMVIPANMATDGGGGFTREQIEDFVAAMFTGGTHSGITAAYDDVGGFINLTVTGGGGGEINTASNVGTAGVGVFKQKTGVDLEFKKINAGSTKVTVTDDVANSEVDIDVNEANFDLDSMVDGATNKVYTATEQTKLAGVEAGADVTDAANVAAAGAIMDGDFTVNGLMKRTGAGTYATATEDTDYQGVPAEGAFVDGDKTKLDGIEASADVTDAVNVGSSIHGATAKTTPVDADTMPLIDSAAANVLKKVTWANIKATLKTYIDSMTSTFTNKRIQPRVYSTTSLATLTPEIDTYDVFTLTAQAAALTIANHSTSTPADGEQMRIRVKDNATARAITFGTNYSAAGGIALPTTTTISKQMTMGFEWYASLSKWVLVALAEEA